jgi:hypothetical protein
MKQPFPINPQPQQRFFMLRFEKRRKLGGMGLVAVLLIGSSGDGGTPSSPAYRASPGVRDFSRSTP